jgi:hypothetical protein
MDGQWTKEMVGGRVKMEGADNPYWCTNPQYYMNLEKPTHLKIILRKYGGRRAKDAKVGLCICRDESNTNIASTKNLKGAGVSLKGVKQNFSSSPTKK